MADVFISYRNLPNRRALVQRLATILRAYGIDVWWDYSILPGTDYRDGILREVLEARVVVPLWCEKSIKSDWVLQEATWGKDRLLPARIQAVSPPDPFSNTQAAHLETWNGSILDVNLERFITQICDRLGLLAQIPADTKAELAGLRKLKPLPNVAREGKWKKPVLGLVGIGVVGLSGYVGSDMLRQVTARKETSSSAPVVMAVPDPFAVAAGGGPIRQREFRDCTEIQSIKCPRMVALPSGYIWMGSDFDRTKPLWPDLRLAAPEDEGPALSEPIQIAAMAVGKYEVTWSEYEACVEDGGCSPAKNMDGFGGLTRPVTNVTHDQAAMYAAWLSRKTGQNYRLLSEAEWEYAARAGSRELFHFGSDRNALCEYANGADLTLRKDTPAEATPSDLACEDEYRNTAPVDDGKRKANAFGLHDMHGNVWEWVADCYSPQYSLEKLTASNGEGSKELCESYVSRGGAWSSNAYSLRSAMRSYQKPDPDRGPVFSDRIGFRVARLPTAATQGAGTEKPRSVQPAEK